MTTREGLRHAAGSALAGTPNAGSRQSESAAPDGK
jgi:hypothetical protein